ncbi:fasciclin-like arabinogalactan protein 2 [Quercus suber]|uniref:Fasciclin-like arabinogalactan protein 2 n=1 Tax=Quercus suber TaxID=58331 RepID=A0AAW0KEC7_QUESU
MQQSPPLTAIFTIPLLLVFLLPSSNAHNITQILAQHPEFSTFNHYLTITHLASEINRRLTITVLAVDNAAMSSLLSKHLSVYTIKNVLSLHVLVDYFGSKKLHQITNGSALTSSMFQATGSAPGSSGYVNVTDLKGGKVGFGAEDDNGNLDAVYVKSVKEIPYNISVLQISQQGCKAFADLLIASGADTTFQENIDGGLTVFCPTDTVINGFMPKFKNLTAPQKISLLLYHGIPVYQSIQMLKSNNGIINTLATDGANKYDFTVQNDGEEITLKTKVVTAKVTGTLKDEEPLVVYKVDKVLLPRELFKVAPTTKAEAPKAAKEAAAAAPTADSPEGDDVGNQTADNNGASGLDGGRLILMVILSFCVGFLAL